MDANLLLGTTGLVGTAFGVWGLMLQWDKRKNGNGSHPVELAPQGLVESEVAQSVRELPQKIEQGLTPVLERALERIEAQAETPAEVSPPAWPPEMVSLFERLTARLEEPPLPPVWPAGLADNLNRITDRLEALLQMNPPPPVELEKLAEPLAQLPQQLDEKFNRLTQQIGTLVHSPLRTVPQGGEPKPRAGRPTTRAPGPIHLDIFNTVTLDGDTIYELIPPEPGIYNVSVMNLGPGTLHMRANAEPAIDDPHATTIPWGGGDNEIHTPGSLLVVADDDVTLSIRLTHWS